MRRLLTAAAFLVLASACAKGTKEPSPDTGARVHLEVTNGYALPVEISVYSTSTVRRLGTVHPGMSAHFVVPPQLVGGRNVQFIAQPPASNTSPANVYRSAELLLAPGNIVDMEVAAVLFNSTTSVRP
jgi:hypothetical protein